MFTKRLTALASALLLAGTAHASIVTNGGFENGTSGWEKFGSSTNVGADGFAAIHSGAAAAYFGPVGTTGGMFQTLNTVAGETYNVSFWLRNNAATSPRNFLDFNWDGGAAELSIVFPQDYSEFTFTLVATSASTDLRFIARGDRGYFYVDDVSVTALSAAPVPTDVPEPASLALVSLALVGAGVASRRKRG